MVRRFLFLTLFVLTILLLDKLIAQEDFSAGKRIIGIQVDTIQHNNASLLFDKSLNTYHWNGITSYKNTFGPLFLQLNEQFFSTLIWTERNLITDNQFFDLKTRYRLTDKLSAASNINSFILSDNRSSATSIGKASSYGFYGGIAYQPFDQLTVEPLIGIRFDNQFYQHDKGISYLLNIDSDPIILSGYSNRLKGSFQYDKLDPRTLETHSASIGIEKIFFEQTRNSLQLNYYRNRRDFYLPADSAIKSQHNIFYNIESRFDNIFTISDTLDYNIGQQMFWTLGGNIFTRDINRSIRYKNIADPVKSQAGTDITELKIEGLIRGMYVISNSLRTSLAFSYLERDEKHQPQDIGNVGSINADLLTRNEERKNNHARRTSLASATEWCVSTSDTIIITGSGNLLRYDTPSKDNDDDRDELWYLLNITTHHRLNRYLQLHLTADASMTHLVYLFASRSADNNWNRIIRLAPRADYTPFDEFKTTNIFEVLANYTVYDFESIITEPQSYAFRQFAFVDSSNIFLTKRLSFNWFNYIRLYDRGELSWNTFSERPINYFEEKTFLGTLKYSLNQSLLLSIGLRYFSQLKFDYNGATRTLNTYLRSIGPTTNIEIDVGTRTHCAINGWYESQSQTGQRNRGVTTISLLLSIGL